MFKCECKFYAINHTHTHTHTHTHIPTLTFEHIILYHRGSLLCIYLNTIELFSSAQQNFYCAIIVCMYTQYLEICYKSHYHSTLICHWSCQLLEGRGEHAATTFYKRLAAMLSKKIDVPYSKMMGWIRCRLNFSLLRASVMSIRGTRYQLLEGHFHKPI